MANTKQPELKEPGPSDDQLIDYKKSHVRQVSSREINIHDRLFDRKRNN